MIPTPDIKAAGQALFARLRAARRALHQHPELSFKEIQTTQRISGWLNELGLDDIRIYKDGVGVTALLKGGRRGAKTVALRADLDALQITEANPVPYRSQVPGVMHACGHDGHMAMVLGAAMILAQRRRHIRGTVKFIFQPAEENTRGALQMIRQGVLRHPAVDAIFGLHLMPQIDFGRILVTPGPVMAANDHMTIVVHGRGGHGAHPETCVDPILVAHQIYDGLRSISRNLGGLDSHVISVCAFQAGGTAYNIIPETAEIRATVRTLRPETQSLIQRRVQDVAIGIASTHHARCEVTYCKSCPVTHNDAALARLCQTAAQTLGIPVQTEIVTMASEDFSHYQQKVRGIFLMLGIRKHKSCPGLHNDRFDFDERILPIGATMLALSAIRALEASRS